MRLKFLLIGCMCLSLGRSSAQTDLDAIMMGKHQLCIGPAYTYSSWKNYWEGTNKRINENLGTVSMQMASLMGNYGISDKLNVLFSMPYIKTKASAGTLHSMQGIQDLNLFLKYMPIEKDWGNGTISIYAIGGLTIPVTNYIPDYLPLSIGLHSRMAHIRVMADYQLGDWFITGSATRSIRSNVKIDRQAYYTTQLINSNVVDMPDASQLQARVGYRSDRLIAEAIVTRSVTNGGFDITRNNMPFLSNKMDATSLGVNGKYVIDPKHELALIGGFNQVIAGRNVGQSMSVYGGVFYVVEFSKHEKKATPPAPASKN